MEIPHHIPVKQETRDQAFKLPTRQKAVEVAMQVADDLAKMEEQVRALRKAVLDYAGTTECAATHRLDDAQKALSVTQYNALLDIGDLKVLHAVHHIHGATADKKAETLDLIVPLTVVAMEANQKERDMLSSPVENILNMLFGGN